MLDSACRDAAVRCLELASCERAKDSNTILRPVATRKDRDLLVAQTGQAGSAGADGAAVTVLVDRHSQDTSN